MDIRRATTQRLKEKYNVEETIADTLFEIGVIDEGAARNFLIKSEYQDRSKMLGKTIAKIQLAEKYNCSYSTVEKIILKKFADKTA